MYNAIYTGGIFLGLSRVPRESFLIPRPRYYIFNIIVIFPPLLFFPLPIYFRGKNLWSSKFRVLFRGILPWPLALSGLFLALSGGVGSFLGPWRFSCSLQHRGVFMNWRRGNGCFIIWMHRMLANSKILLSRNLCFLVFFPPTNSV